MKGFVMKKRGFTLAEVLITLGIIGVVAAMTLPSLIGSYQKQAWVTQLRKTVSTLEQGFQKMRVDNGSVDSLEDTEPFVKMRASNTPECISWEGSAECEEFYKKDLTKYFNIDFVVASDDYKYWSRVIVDEDEDYYDMASASMVVFPDGAMVYFWFIDYLVPAGYDIAAQVYIDVNGLKAPNKLGYDVFRLSLLDNGKLIDSAFDGRGDIDIKERCLSGRHADGCYAYLAANGWKMDY